MCGTVAVASWANSNIAKALREGRGVSGDKRKINVAGTVVAR